MAKVVFCEDDDLTRKLIGLVLRGTPHVPFFAADGLEGLAVIERERPALVVTDLHMGGLDGPHLLAALRSRSDLAHIPVILMSGAVEGDVVRNVPSGPHVFAACMAKPFSAGVLRSLIEELLSRSS